MLKRLACALLLAGGCYATTDSYVAYDEPPPVREETVIYRPGYTYIHGHWLSDGHHWRWHSGYYERDRPGYVYVEGRWERHGNRHVYINGGWRSGGAVVIRDHRHHH